MSGPNKNLSLCPDLKKFKNKISNFYLIFHYSEIQLILKLKKWKSQFWSCSLFLISFLFPRFKWFPLALFLFSFSENVYEKINGKLMTEILKYINYSVLKCSKDWWKAANSFKIGKKCPRNWLQWPKNCRNVATENIFMLQKFVL